MNAIASSSTDQLFEQPAFSPDARTRELFLESFREVAAIHYGGSRVFRAFWDDAQLKPENIRTEKDLLKVPPLMVHLFKERELFTGLREKIVLTLTSSGTGGQKSQMLLDETSLARVKRLAYRVHEDLGITSTKKYNYLCFTYDPKVANDLGTAFTDELLTQFTGKKDVYYTFQFNEAKSDFIFNKRGTLEFLREAENDFKATGTPVRILGFPAFLYQLIRDNNLSFNLGPDSWVQTGGGWKGQADEQIPKDEFRAYVSEHLGIPKSNIRDLFGMVEHGIPYVDCRLGRMHIPEFARVYVRSPKDLNFLPEGESGLLQFICTYNQSYPAMNLLTTDWGRIGRCNCGIGSPTLEITGRAGVTKHKGCAVKAADML
jgi:phenylacetate-coenzyme A ligase PaaK-like adenylate-forming protein